MRAATVLLLAALLGCSGKGVSHSTQTAPAIPATVSPSMSLVGRYGFAHACPIDGKILTAAHVVERQFPSGATELLSFVYSQGDSHGFLAPRSVIPSRDIAFLRLMTGDEPEDNQISERTPRTGDAVHWYEFDYTSRAAGMRISRREAKVIRTISGHVVFDRPPAQGASGGCLLNASDEVVGLVAWSIEMGYHQVGFGPLLTGDWKPF